MRFARAAGILVGSIAAAVAKLFVWNVEKQPSPRSEPLDLSGTGAHYNARTGNYDNGQDPYGIYPNDDHRF